MTLKIKILTKWELFQQQPIFTPAFKSELENICIQIQFINHLLSMDTAVKDAS